MNAKDLTPPIWTTGSTEVYKTGSWRAALPRHISAPSPCHAACPVNGDIAEWLGQAREGDLRGAWETLTRHNPFPAIAGSNAMSATRRSPRAGDLRQPPRSAPSASPSSAAARRGCRRRSICAGAAMR